MPSNEPVLRQPETDDEVAACYEIVVRSLGFPRERLDLFRETLDRERALGVFVDGTAAAFARIRPFGLFLGGERVPMGGHSPVSTAPEFRGRGFGSMVTAGHFPDLRERGEVIAALYPATTSLYRGVGFGIAGAWNSYKVPARSLQTLRPVPGVAIRQASMDDLPGVKDAYRRQAQRTHGHLDRSDGWWEFIMRDLDKSAYLYVVDRADGGIAGYVYYHQSPRPDWGYRINVSEVKADDADTAVALWRLVGSSSTMASDVSMSGTPEHELLLLLPEQDLVQTESLRYMVRMIDLPGAFAARGYPLGARGTVDFELEDRDCPWNTGRWRLSFEDGNAAMAKGGDGAVRITPAALATLYSGYASATKLQMVGALPGATEREVKVLDDAFAGPTPWMPEIF